MVLLVFSSVQVMDALRKAGTFLILLVFISSRKLWLTVQNFPYLGRCYTENSNPFEVQFFFT